MEKLNIAEILKNFPKGTKLYSPIFGEVELDEILSSIFVRHASNKALLAFYEDGKWHSNGECMLFPSKENRDWNKFIPFKDGDVIYTRCKNHNTFISIFREIKGEKIYTSCDLGACLYIREFNFLCKIGDVKEQRFATEEEKEKLFKAIKDNGYKWNAETKTLKKLVEPKFKVGDRIRYAGEDFAVKIIDIKNNQYHIEYFCDKYNDYKNGIIPVSEQNNYMLIPKFDITTLKAFDKVLVRYNSLEKWHIQFFEKYNTELGAKYPFICLCNSKYCQCIPYEGNEHLLGTTNNCNDYYKTWE